MKQKISILIIALLVALYAAFDNLQALAQQTACYGAQGGTVQTAASGCEYEFQSGSILDVQASATATFANNPSFTGNPTFSNMTGSGTFTTSDLNVTDDATISSTLVYSQQTALTVTDGGTITPTGTYQLLTAAGAVGASVSTSCTAGSIFHFENTANQTITITDTGNIVLAGNAALGQYDTLTVICDGTRVVELARANN